MPTWLVTAAEFLAGPVIFSIVLPVIPTIWLFVVYPLFAYRINHAKIQFSYWARIGLFYLFTALVCAPALPAMKNTVEHPAILLPLLKSPGFILLAAYASATLILHKPINRLVNSSPVIRSLRNNAVVIGYTVFLKLKLAWANGFNGKARS